MENINKLLKKVLQLADNKTTGSLIRLGKEKYIKVELCISIDTLNDIRFHLAKQKRGEE